MAGTFLNMKDKLRYRVEDLSKAGLQAYWTKTDSGERIIKAILDGGEWFYVTRGAMWQSMQEKGVIEGFKAHTECSEASSGQV